MKHLDPVRTLTPIPPKAGGHVDDDLVDAATGDEGQDVLVPLAPLALEGAHVVVDERLGDDHPAAVVCEFLTVLDLPANAPLLVQRVLGDAGLDRDAYG